MGVQSLYRKKPKPFKRIQINEFSFLSSVSAKVIFQSMAAIFVILFISMLCSSTFHACVSSRKLNRILYCLSDDRTHDHSGFRIPTDSVLVNSTNDTKANEFDRTIITIADSDYIKSSNDGNRTLEDAFEEVEERTQRSWISYSSPHSITCEGRGIYVYELPSKFNKDLMAECNDMIPGVDFCKYFTNEALGERIQSLGDRWYNTHQFSLEPFFHAKMLKHPCRVHNQAEAKLFYVPYYGGLDLLRWQFKNVTHNVKDSLGSQVVRWLESHTSWYKNLGMDHVFVVGKTSLDFRRRNGDLWRNRLLALDEMQNPMKLLIEQHPWNVNEIGIPPPTFFHPQTDDDIIKWQLKVMKSKRTNLVSFDGTARTGMPKSVRSILINQCISAKDKECKFLDCKKGECNRPESIIELFSDSEFCLQPPGGSPTRKSLFDSLISGCIPVIFDYFAGYYRYPWHLPEDGEKYWVSVEKEELRKGAVNVVERLMRIPVKERENMRRYIVHELLPGLVYGDVNARFDKFQDAFAITLDNLLDRVNILPDL